MSNIDTMENILNLASNNAIKLNDDAILFLQEGDHEKTTNALFDAVACLDALSSINQQPIQGDKLEHHQKADELPQALPRIDCVPIPEDLADGGTEQDDVFPYFNRALSVQIEKGGITHETHARVSSILLYNMALSHHHEAIRRYKSSELCNALKLYELSYCTIERAKDHMRMEDVFILLLALFFNMACIHQKLFNAAECQHCVDWLQKAMASREIITLTDEEYFFFSTNISLFSFQMPHWAPAA